jgi:glycosyltransferase involved in cell wall biosynthesis
MRLKEKGKKIIYRLDGVFFENRLDNKWVYIDEVCRAFANSFVDGVIYQTEWVKQRQLAFGVNECIPNASIINAPNDKIFYREYPEIKKYNNKVRLVATSWSTNKRKGLHYYQYLDEHLNYDKYEFLFIGNIDGAFKNIRLMPPLPTEALASELRKHDIFVSCAFDEPCSNSLVEAMHLGLPAVGHKSGGTPEIIQEGGELFLGKEDLIPVIDSVAKNYSCHKKNINLPSISQVARQYYDFGIKLDSKPLPSKRTVISFYALLNKYNLVGWRKVIQKVRKKLSTFLYRPR